MMSRKGEGHRPTWWSNTCGPTVLMVSPWQRLRARLPRWGADPLLLGSACSLKIGVEVRLLRLTYPCARALGLSCGGLAAGPGDLRRHRAAQLVKHRVHCHPWRIPRRQPPAQQIGHEGARDPPTALPRDMVGLLGIAHQRGERPTERLRLGPHTWIIRIIVVCLFQRGARHTFLPRPHLLFQPRQHLLHEGTHLHSPGLAELHTRAG